MWVCCGHTGKVTECPGEAGFLAAMMKDVGLPVAGQSGADPESNTHDFTSVTRVSDVGI